MKYRKLKGYKFGLVETINFKLVGYSGPTVEHSFFAIKQFDGGWFMVAKKGYAWDGSSIPYKWLLGIFYDVDKYCKVPSLVHDIAYQAGWLGLLPLEHRNYFDRLYRDMMIARGMSKSQANRRYWAVSKYSEKYFKPKKDERDIVYEAI